MAKSYDEWSARAKEIGINDSYAAYQGYLNNIGETDPALSAPKPTTSTSSSTSSSSNYVAEDVPAGAKTYAQWSARAKELGWSPDQYSTAAYEGYLNNLRGSGSGGGGGGGGGGGISISVPERPPIPLVYPMITPEYSAPMAQDFSAYMPADSIFGGQNGLLYQPWSQEYLQQYVPQGLINYTPPEINGMMPVYRQNPIGLLDVIAAAEELVAEEGGSGGDKKPKSSDDDLDMRGGKGPGDVGYNASNPAYGYANIGELVADMSDRIAGGQGLTAGPGAGWGNDKAGAGIGVSGGTGKGPAAGGMGKGY